MLLVTIDQVALESYVRRFRWVQESAAALQHITFLFFIYSGERNRVDARQLHPNTTVGLPTLRQQRFQALYLLMQCRNVARTIFVDGGFVLDEFGPLRKLQCRQRLPKTLGCGADIGNHERFRVPPQRIPQQERQFGVAISDVTCFSIGHIHQGLVHVSEQQACLSAESHILEPLYCNSLTAIIHCVPVPD